MCKARWNSIKHRPPCDKCGDEIGGDAAAPVVDDFECECQERLFVECDSCKKSIETHVRHSICILVNVIWLGANTLSKKRKASKRIHKHSC